MKLIENWDLPLGDLSWAYMDHQLSVGDPEDIAYLHIEDRENELRDFYEQTLGVPIEDELKVAKKIRQLNFCCEEDQDRKDLLRGMVNADGDSWPPVVDDPKAALTELEELLRELRIRYPIHGHKAVEESVTNSRHVEITVDGGKEMLIAVPNDASDDEIQAFARSKYPELFKQSAELEQENLEELDEPTPTDGGSGVERTAIDWWSNVFQDIEKLRSVVPHVNKPRGKPEGFVARLFSRWKHESFAEEIATMNRELYRRIGHLPHDSDSYLSLVDRLRGHIRMAFAESSGADSTRSEKFHRCFVDAIRYRYCIVHDPDRWSVEHELEWMKRYIDLPVHTPWLTNYILAAVFDRRITEARSELRSFFGGVRSFFGGVWITLSFMLAIVIGTSVLFAFRVVWAWPVVAFLIWMAWGIWAHLCKNIKAAEIRSSLLHSVREEIVTGCYDAEEISRRLQSKELTVAFPSLVYPLLRLGSKNACVYV